MYSAFVLPLPTSLSWGNASLPGAQLPAVVPQVDFSVGPFAQRDSNLQYRDLQNAASIAQIATAIADVWGVTVPYPMLPASPAGTLLSNPADLPGSSYSSPGATVPVKPTSVPTDAAISDQWLYARDLVLYAWLQKVGSLLSNDPLQPLALSPAVLNDAWSLGGGKTDSSTVSLGYPLNTELFNRPDSNLAARDNTLAAYIALIRHTIDRIWTVAERLLVQTVTPTAVVGEPEVYQLISDDANVRVWSLWPQLQGPAGKIIYNKSLQTITWQDETVGPSTSGVPVQPNFTTPDGGIVQLQYQVPDAPDAEFFRQKSARLVIRTWKDSVIFTTTTPENYILSGGLWQPNGALITTPGIVQLVVPAIIPSGCIRVGLLVKPSRILNILGYQNTGGFSDGTNATIVNSGTLSWSFTAPAGGILVSFLFQDKLAPTTSFSVIVSYNAVVIYQGAWAYGKTPGTTVLTPPVQLTATGQPCLITVQWLGNPGGQLTINEVQVTTVLPAGTPVNYSISASIGAQASPSTSLSGVAERLDCVWLDVFNPAQQVSPTLAINWLGAAGIALYVYAYDLRLYTGATTLQSAPLYEGHKKNLLVLAEDTVVKSWSQLVPLLKDVELRTTDPVYGFVWDSKANQAWVSTISLDQPRLTEAFQVAGPGDVGRPALIPEGLVLAADGTVLATNPTQLLTPVLKTCQAWMVDFNCLVAGPDFWPTLTRACVNQNNAVFLVPDFDYTIINPQTGAPSITNLTSTSTTTMATPGGDAFVAYNLINVGPGGGFNTQSIIVTAWFQFLTVGATYTISVTTAIQVVGGGTSTVINIQPFLATTSQMSVELSEINALPGTIVTVLGASVA